MAVRLEFYRGYSWAAVRLGGMCSYTYNIFSIIYSYHATGKECFVSLPVFSELLGVSERSVRRGIDILEEFGVVYVGRCNYRNSNQYTVEDRVVDQWRNEYDAVCDAPEPYKSKIAFEKWQAEYERIKKAVVNVEAPQKLQIHHQKCDSQVITQTKVYDDLPF